MNTFFKPLVLASIAIMAISLPSCKTTETLSDCEDPASTNTCFEVTTDAFGAAAVRITDRGEGVGTRVFSSDTVYILANLVYVNSGQVLTIESGTVIRGESGTGADASGLVVARGGRLMAEGTQGAPIIFTSTDDNLTMTSDLPADVNYKWGGLIILGNASITASGGTERAIEGIPVSETRGLYGGNNDADNSGVIRYVSVRHCGSEIGAGNEINGITLGGVGSGTTIDHVEVFSTYDDGIEFFGGTVNITHALISYYGDDGIDFDEGYRGKMQFVLVLQKPGTGNRGIEGNGVNNSDSYTQATLCSDVSFANITFVGGNNAGGGENDVVKMRQGARGRLDNCVYYNWAKKLSIDDSTNTEPFESEYWMTTGDLAFNNSLFSKIGTATDLSGVTTASLLTYLQSGLNQYNNTNPIVGVAVAPGASTFNPLAAAPALAVGPVAPMDNFFVNTTYIGAFNDTDNWAAGWSALTAYGIF